MNVTDQGGKVNIVGYRFAFGILLKEATLSVIHFIEGLCVTIKKMRKL